VEATETALQTSVAFAVPSAVSISVADGLHPKGTVVKLLVKTGACVSADHVTILDAVSVLPQPSVALNVIVCYLEHVPLM